MDCYIFHTASEVRLLLLIVAMICNHYARYRSKQKNIKNIKKWEYKVNGRIKITKHKNIFVKGYIEKWSKEIFITDFVLKTNPWTYEIRDINK